MAFRRRIVRRRAPVRRYYRPRTRRVIRRRRRRVRRSSGNFHINVRKSTQLVLDGDKPHTVQVSPRFSDFNELEPFATAFEAYRIHSLRVTVRPHFNTAQPDSTAAPYYIAPWHKLPGNVSTEVVRSIDRCKSYNGASTGSRIFVPAVLTAISNLDAPEAIYGKTNWRPRIELVGKANDLRHYCGIIHFGSTAQTGSVPPPSRSYEIEYSARITLYNQKWYQQ